jgi:hypothetical protein
MCTRVRMHTVSTLTYHAQEEDAAEEEERVRERKRERQRERKKEHAREMALFRSRARDCERGRERSSMHAPGDKRGEGGSRGEAEGRVVTLWAHSKPASASEPISSACSSPTCPTSSASKSHAPPNVC